MKYKNVIQGNFISRPNRFIAKVLVDGYQETVHVKNTGRCREIFIPGATVYLSVSDNHARKTKYDLIAVEKTTENGTILINTDSQIPNYCAEEFLPHSGLFPSDVKIRREVKYGNSRFDIFAEYEDKKAFIEVKGVTLENDGTALFPDAPTERGVKHIRELIKAKKEGYDAYIMFIIQMDKVHTFSPNTKTHPEFAEALKEAHKNGVKILAYKSEITPDSITVTVPVKVKLT
ncbi:MAG: DNA/RNA nuclease SfsA [Clostridia bacterium]|nr:DNA/RNA nuclease SfsA [Clostridia bacterium]